MDLGRLQRGEIIAVAGGLLLGISLFLGWYHAEGLARVAEKQGTVSGWETHSILRWLILAAAAAPLILAYIIARDYTLSWPRGEMTAVVAIAAFGLIGYQAFIDKPGDVPGSISLRFGIYLAILGTVLMLVGAATRSSEVERGRKPPGSL
jgi:hypothetical protein